MSRLTGNIVANFAGRVATVVIGVIFVPLYVAHLGAEGFGLIGVFTALQSILVLFDFGLGTTLTRQVALESRDPDRARGLASFLRTVEWVYWGVTATLVCASIALGSLIGQRWIQADSLGPGVVARAVTLLAIAAALQLPFAMYGGGLLGLQRQVAYNAVLTGIMLVRSIGALVVLQVVSADVVTFFAWQVAISATQSLLGAALLWRSLPPGQDPPRFSGPQLRSVWRFAVGSAGTSALGILRSQIDKVVLTRLLSLTHFGYYSIAGILASGVYFLATPFYMAYFPRLSELVSTGDERLLSEAYHEACQLLSSLILPAVAIATAFAYELIIVWTGNTEVAANAWLPASLLLASYGCVALNGLPYTLQLAYGWTGLGLIVSASTFALAVPLMWIGASRGGAAGAATGWLVVNAIYLIALVHGMHRRVLVGQLRRWYWGAVALPLTASVTVATVMKAAMPSQLGRIATGFYIVMASIVALATVVIATPAARRRMLPLLEHLARSRA